MTNRLQEKLKENEKIVGSIASVLAIIMFFSLIEIFFSNIKGDSNIFILPLATALNCLFWSLYAYGRKDIFVFVPNFIGLILGVFTALSASI
jgi:hypothetical protein